MKTLLYLPLIAVLLFASCADKEIRTSEDFNFDWKFVKGEPVNAEQIAFNDSDWEPVRLPHDWSNITGYQKENTAASTGFVEGGIGWYRKTFEVPKSDKGKAIWIEFDGVFCNSTVWINGIKLGFRPNGYSGFSHQLSEHLHYGGDNLIAVKVDHSAYADTRWYTGSGIYRNVRLIKTSPVHIPQWGVRITTPDIDTNHATVHIKTQIEGSNNVDIEISILDSKGAVVASNVEHKISNENKVSMDLFISKPQLWGTETPILYTANISVKQKGKLVDQIEQRFGIRQIKFDARKGFFLNGKNTPLKGVNLHHDLGAVGTADSKAIWEYRIKQLKSIGVNAIRMSHNPHSPQLMDVCDEMGMLVMDEFFDEWHNPKGKSVIYLGDEAAEHKIAKGYSDVFFEWAEKDLKDLIHRDFNHPSVIMWSIGNEIEWTFPDYAKTFALVNPNIDGYHSTPLYDTELIKKTFREVTQGNDSLAIVAKQLAQWVKEEDTTRPTICGSVIPSVSMMSGYGDAVDILGLNYRAADYDEFHKTFPDKCILGSENWVAYSEWKNANQRSFVPGIFVWTGFAYRGEAGPWPRKGLNISLFDFAGFKTPRGHFFECMWKPEPKIYMVTTPASESEFSYTKKEGWQFDIQLTPPPVWNKLRLWEWYKVNEHWNYKPGEEIVVQTYTNCEEAELFLNGKSQGKQALADFAAEDNIIKWLVPFQKGELKVVGYNKGKVEEEYILASSGKVSKIEIIADKNTLIADNYDVAHIVTRLYDSAGNQIKDLSTEITFEVTGNAELIAVDNGWEMNVDSHLKNSVKTHNGKALAVIRANATKGTCIVTASIEDVTSNTVRLDVTTN